MCCMRSQRRRRSPRQGNRPCGTARWAAAQAVAAGALDLAALETLPDARLLEALMQQHGVGIKVANCVALFAYGRMECAPVDVWIQRVIDQHYAGQNPFPAYGNAGILQQWMFYFARSEKERVK